MPEKTTLANLSPDCWLHKQKKVILQHFLDHEPTSYPKHVLLSHKTLISIYSMDLSVNGCSVSPFEQQNAIPCSMLSTAMLPSVCL